MDSNFPCLKVATDRWQASYPALKTEVLEKWEVVSNSIKEGQSMIHIGWFLIKFFCVR